MQTIVYSSSKLLVLPANIPDFFNLPTYSVGKGIMRMALENDCTTCVPTVSPSSPIIQSINASRVSVLQSELFTKVSY